MVASTATVTKASGPSPIKPTTYTLRLRPSATATATAAVISSSSVSHPSQSSSSEPQPGSSHTHTLTRTRTRSGTTGGESRAKNPRLGSSSHASTSTSTAACLPEILHILTLIGVGWTELKLSRVKTRRQDPLDRLEPQFGSFADLGRALNGGGGRLPDTDGGARETVWRSVEPLLTDDGLVGAVDAFLEVFYGLALHSHAMERSRVCRAYEGILTFFRAYEGFNFGTEERNNSMAECLASLRPCLVAIEAEFPQWEAVHHAME